MTVRQSILKFLYPFLRRYSLRKHQHQNIKRNKDSVLPPVPFYSLKATLIDKTVFDFRELEGKKIMVVNLASNCGFTAQFEELEKLSRRFSSRMHLLGFPSNDFKGQEPGTDEEIEKFCRAAYGVSFLLFAKAAVIGPGQQPVFEWLSKSKMNGWNDQQPSWNFCKYLLDENGILQNIFSPPVSPLSHEIVNAIEAPSVLSVKAIHVSE